MGWRKENGEGWRGLWTSASLKFSEAMNTNSTLIDGLSSEDAVLARDESLPDVLLVNVLEHVRRVDENAQRAADCHRQKHVQLQTV